MKFMYTWKAQPGQHKPAAERFLKSGGPMPAGLKMIGRWHAPGSVCGWLLVESDDLKGVYEHAAEWANYLDFQVTPVVEDTEAAKGMAKVYGK